MNRLQKIIIGIIVVVFLVVFLGIIAFWGIIAFVATHFISKIW